MERFEYSTTKYKFIVDNIIFNEPKKEREILDLSVRGYNNTEIGNIIGMSEKTVYRRKKEIKKKILQLF